jgi:hypothetical protein
MRNGVKKVRSGIHGCCTSGSARRLRPTPVAAAVLLACAALGAGCAPAGLGSQSATPADAFFAVGEASDAFPGPSDVIEHYEAYLERFGGEGGDDLRVRALVRIAEAHRERARCAADATEERREACRAEREKAWEYAERALEAIALPEGDLASLGDGVDPAAMLASIRERTRAALAAVVAPHVAGDTEGTRQARIDDRTAMAAEALGQARLYAGERIYEAFTAIEWPAFDPGDRDPPPDACARPGLPEEYAGICEGVERYRLWATTAFTPFVAERNALLARAREFWNPIAYLHVPRWETAAASRIGEMLQRFWEDLVGAPVPEVFERPEFADLGTAFREQMNAQAETFRKMAVDAFGYCLVTAERERIRTEYVERCEAGMRELDPGSVDGVRGR